MLSQYELRFIRTIPFLTMKNNGKRNGRKYVNIFFIMAAPFPFGEACACMRTFVNAVHELEALLKINIFLENTPAGFRI